MKIETDPTTTRLTQLLRDKVAEEPPEADSGMPDYLQAETAMVHCDWQRQVNALRLLIGTRLTTLALATLEKIG